MDHGKRKEAAKVIRAFATGTGGPYDWDGFISPKRKDAEEQEVVDYCTWAEGLYPSEKGAWCSEEGLVKLIVLADMLESPVPFGAISDFIQAEYKRLGVAPRVESRPPKKRLAWYWSRVFWFGLLGFVFLVWLWGYKLEAPTEYRWQRSGGSSHVGVGDSRVWFGSNIHGHGPALFGSPEEDFEVIEKPLSMEPIKWHSVKTDGSLPSSTGYGFFTVIAGHGLLVACYGLLWLVVLVFWQRRKHRLRGSVTAKEAGWMRIAVPVAGMVVMAVALTKRDKALPRLWITTLGDAREVWDQLNEDGKVTASEIIERYYEQGRDLDEGVFKTTLALAGQEDDPIPALRKMMGDEKPERRAFAALTAGLLDDVRLRADLEKLRADQAPLPGTIYTTVEDAAANALLGGGGVKNMPAEMRRQTGAWLQLGETNK